MKGKTMEDEKDERLKKCPWRRRTRRTTTETTTMLDDQTRPIISGREGREGGEEETRGVIPRKLTPKIIAERGRKKKQETM